MRQWHFLLLWLFPWEASSWRRECFYISVPHPRDGGAENWRSIGLGQVIYFLCVTSQMTTNKKCSTLLQGCCKDQLFKSIFEKLKQPSCLCIIISPIQVSYLKSEFLLRQPILDDSCFHFLQILAYNSESLDSFPPLTPVCHYPCGSPHIILEEFARNDFLLQNQVAFLAGT